MIRIFPFIFIILWSSAFITTKPIIDNSDPFAALAFRFFFVALGFLLFSIYSKYSIIINKKKPKVTRANLKARAANGSLLSIIGFVVMNAEDQRTMNIKGSIFNMLVL